MSRLPDVTLFEALQTYYEFRDGTNGSSLGKLQSCEPENSTPRESARMLYVAEMGVALQRLSPGQRHAILFWYWVLQTYMLACLMQARNNVFFIELSKQRNNVRKKKALQELAGEYQNKAMKALSRVQASRDYKDGMEGLSETLKKIFYSYRRRAY